MTKKHHLIHPGPLRSVPLRPFQERVVSLAAVNAGTTLEATQTLQKAICFVKNNKCFRFCVTVR